MTRFPNETEEYRAARNDLMRAEIELRRQIAGVAEQRSRLPLGGEVPEDYAFAEWDPAVGKARTTHLSELFSEGKDSLFLYCFMYRPGPDGDPLEVPCPVCTSIIDGLDGIVRHVRQRLELAVVAKAPIEQFAAHARSRGWRNLRLLSSSGTTFNRDYAAEGENEEQFAIATVFTRRDGRVRHFWSSELWYEEAAPGQHKRHVDFLWPMWAIFDRTPDGRDPVWMPSLEYDAQ
jgi:predicted dithiol-disulfide oxidoreductase (DUF899 family)